MYHHSSLLHQFIQQMKQYFISAQIVCDFPWYSIMHTLRLCMSTSLYLLDLSRCVFTSEFSINMNIFVRNLKKKSFKVLALINLKMFFSFWHLLLVPSWWVVACWSKGSWFDFALWQNLFRLTGVRVNPASESGYLGFP